MLRSLVSFLDGATFSVSSSSSEGDAIELASTLRPRLPKIESAIELLGLLDQYRKVRPSFYEVAKLNDEPSEELPPKQAVEKVVDFLNLLLGEREKVTDTWKKSRLDKLWNTVETSHANMSQLKDVLKV